MVTIVIYPALTALKSTTWNLAFGRWKPNYFALLQRPSRHWRLQSSKWAFRTPPTSADILLTADEIGEEAKEAEGVTIAIGDAIEGVEEPTDRNQVEGVT